jgi:hypothetical protein
MTPVADIVFRESADDAEGLNRWPTPEARPESP